MTAYTGSPPTFTAGQKTGVAAGLNNLRDFARAFTDAWTAYTPTLTASTTNPTGWTQTGFYMQAGKLVVCKISLVAGASMTGGSGTYRIALPVAPNTSMTTGIGWLLGYDSSPGNGWQLEAIVSGASYATINVPATYGGTFQAVTNTAPFTWAANDLIRGTLTYEAA